MNLEINEVIYKMSQILTVKDIGELCPSKVKRPVRDGCLPGKISVIGIIMQVKKIKLVGWKEEILFTLSDTENVLVTISSWNDHTKPNLAKVFDASCYKGKIVVVKRVWIMSQEISSSHREFYGEIDSDLPRSVLVLNINTTSYSNYIRHGEPFCIDANLSDIPLKAQRKSAGLVFPIWEDEKNALNEIIWHIVKFHDASDMSFYGNFFELQKFGFYTWLEHNCRLEFDVKRTFGARCKKIMTENEVIAYAWQSVWSHGMEPIDASYI